MSISSVQFLPRSPEQRVLPNVFFGTARIVAKERYREFCRLTFRSPEIAQRVKPGQFVNLYFEGLENELRFERSSLPMLTILPRPFSVLKTLTLRKGEIKSEAPKAFSVLFDIRGTGTSWLAQLTADVPVKVAGPLGKGFWLPEGTKTAVLVAGGIGIAPFPFLAETLKAQGIEVILLLGAQTKDKLPFDPVRAEFPIIKNGKPLSYWSIDEFESMGVRSAIALDKSEEGFFAGTVVQLFETWLSTQKEREGIVVYGCGPKPMLKALSEIALANKLHCQLSLEERMGCGIGICFGCPIPIKGNSYKLCCFDGPVFDASEVDWERYISRNS
ncbi:MAG: dihydroorotate dehydrogenase electron transfer subunit [Armatimonadetes bacterium]|nr:dihydroorotate dehydrogenase electron transfer subunit [Armatimonadota bacterium]MDW8028240.1 dihydroorotate dehydrogenase electron transfer subunit [Armatimonadota bacterium]